MGFNHPITALYALTGAFAVGYTVKTVCQSHDISPLAVRTLAIGSTLTHLCWGKLSMCK